MMAATVRSVTTSDANDVSGQEADKGKDDAPNEQGGTHELAPDVRM